MLKVPSTKSHSVFSSEISAVATAAQGESFVLETCDCYAGQIRSEAVLRPDIDMSEFNRATGPVEVADVTAGDWLLVDIERVSVGDHGVMAVSPGLGLLGDRVIEADSRIVPVRDGRAWVTDSLSVEIVPMVGVIGVAPGVGEVDTELPGTHGGNLDTRFVTTGNRILLQARHEGGLLSAGDLHAAQGDGELGGTGIEIAGEVQLSVRKVEYDGTLPAVEHPSSLSLLSSAKSISEAVRAGFDEAVELMARWHRLDWEEAYRLTSIVSHAEISQMVNPLQTARITIPRQWCALDFD
ncbi:acetamidase/formamidase family protein [Brevibacterium marinum]|nr:acetamidase/formamidase family protein [Brevibacterium marinum]